MITVKNKKQKTKDVKFEDIRTGDFFLDEDGDLTLKLDDRGNEYDNSMYFETDGNCATGVFVSQHVNSNEKVTPVDVNIKYSIKSL